MYVVAAIAAHGDAGLDGLSIARDALGCCARLISLPAVYRTLDRLERRHLVTWEQAGESSPTPARGSRRYKVTREGQKHFERSLGLMPVEEREKIALRAGMAGRRH